MSGKIKLGMEVFICEEASHLKGKRVGLITHSAAVTGDLADSASALKIAGVNLRVLFSPEHGINSLEADGKSVENSFDQRLDIPIYSLYGENREPTPAMLADIDTLIIDLQDVGVRFYTYISTLFYGLCAAGKAAIDVIVLDRPNPLGGVRVEGPRITPGLLSFVGIASLPIRHGLTIGEMALYMNAELHLGAHLTIIKMKGWRRTMDYTYTGLPWVPTSPAMPHLSTVFCYPGTCLVEGTNMSEGRGTPLPFEYVGAPWLDDYKLAGHLNSLELSGVGFRSTVFIPLNDKHAGKLCRGVQVHVLNQDLFLPIRSGLEMIQACRNLAPQDFVFLPTSWEEPLPHFDLLTGDTYLREGIQAGVPVHDLTQGWQVQEEDFLLQRKPFLLYD